jgi:S1-C subfamily serine protease
MLIARSIRTLTWLLATGMPIALAAESPVRPIRSTSGTKGSMQGTRYVIEDPRSMFYAGEDRQVVVYFEWEGAARPHECKITWKDPSGAAVLISPYTSPTRTARFGVYLTLALPESPRLGLWAVEAEVDGQPAGTHTFQIQEGRSAGGARPAARAVLAPAELYARAQVATLTVEAFDAKGGRLAAGSGFLVGDGLVVTAFQIVEGASRLRVVPPKGAAVETTELAAWNRRQDWAVVRTPPLDAGQLTLDRSRSWKVGDRCSFLDTNPDGARVMVDTVIVGAQEFPQAGPRISIQFPVNPRAVGGALLNEYGDALAVLGGALVPGASAGGTRSRGAHVPLAFLVTTMAFPLSSVPSVTPDSRIALQELSARGIVPPPVVGPLNVFTGTIARGVEKRNNVPFPMDEKTEFRSSEGDAVAFLTFDPQEKRQGMGVFRIYDIDNRLAVEGKPVKITLRPRQYSVTMWTFPLARLRPGTYRIDLDLDADPIWRSYFRVVE